MIKRPTDRRHLSELPAYPTSSDEPRADYPLGPDIRINFTTDLPGGDAWWDPHLQVLLVDAGLRGRQLAVTLLHEVGHMLCGDHDDVLSVEEHHLLEDWAQQSASLLDLIRPGRRAVPA